MKSRAAVLVDVPYLYHAQPRGQRLDYNKYMAYARENYDVRLAKAYCNQNQTTFQGMLKAVGFDILTCPDAYSHELVADALDAATVHDTVIIGSAAPYVPMLARRLRAMGKAVVIVAAGVPKDFAAFGTIVPVTDMIFVPPPMIQQPTE